MRRLAELFRCNFHNQSSYLRHEQETNNSNIFFFLIFKKEIIFFPLSMQAGGRTSKKMGLSWAGLMLANNFVVRSIALHNNVLMQMHTSIILAHLRGFLISNPSIGKPHFFYNGSAIKGRG